jgi:hypothetical protein
LNLFSVDDENDERLVEDMSFRAENDIDFGGDD